MPFLIAFGLVGQDPMTAMLPQLLGEMSLDTSAFTVERFVRECAQGRVETVKKMLPKMKERVSEFIAETKNLLRLAEFLY